MRVFHYTTPDCLLSIIAQGIQPATTLVRARERPVVWFTTGEDYEPTALKGVLTKQGEAKLKRAKRRGQARFKMDPGDERGLSLEEQLRKLGLARVEVLPEAAPLDWAAWRRQSGVPLDMADGLKSIAVRRGSAVEDWRVCFGTLAPDLIVGMDVWHEGAWLRVAERHGGAFRCLVGPGSPFPAAGKRVE